MKDDGAASSTRLALCWYLGVFLVLAVLGWGLEIAGQADLADVPVNHSAFFHPREDFEDQSSFGDLTDLAGRTLRLTGPGLRKPGAVSFPYPPAAAFLFRFFNHAVRHGVALYLALLVLFGVGAMWLTARRFGRAQPVAMGVLAATALLGSPQIFCASRGNLEVFVAVLSAAALALLLGGWSWAAAFALGLAMCVKPFPAMLLLLFLWRKQWRQAAAAVVVCLAISTVALYVLGPSVPAAWGAIRDCWSDYYHQQVVTLNIVQEMKTDHSLMDGVKIFLYRFAGGDDLVDVQLDGASGVPVWARLDLWAHVFQAFAVVATGCVAYGFARKPVLNQIFALVLLMLLLPYLSSEYALLLLYLPCAVLLGWMSRNRWRASRRQMLALSVSLALLFAPLNVLGLYSGVAKTLLLLIVFGFVWAVPLEASSEAV